MRLPSYWESVEPTPDQVDFSEIDGLLAVVARHNEWAVNPTRVVLTVGARNFLYPELHEPSWAGPRWQPFLNNMQAAPPYRAYLDTSITRYRDSPLLYAWQVENEPRDYVGNASTGDDQIKVAQLSWEIGEVHRLDPGHEARRRRSTGGTSPSTCCRSTPSPSCRSSAATRAVTPRRCCRPAMRLAWTCTSMALDAAALHGHGPA
ncbi:MAG TPA: hypothetical protein VND54_13460 [Candidatus Saccharimonadales bacterium]|nr:hypothetical protein [Candidatus Saccharimonadales bacterium]